MLQHCGLNHNAAEAWLQCEGAMTVEHIKLHICCSVSQQHCLLPAVQRCYVMMELSGLVL